MQTAIRHVRSAVFGLLALLPLALASCGGGGSGCSGSDCNDSPSQIATISVVANQTVLIDQAKYLSFSAKDSNGKSLSIADSSITWGVSYGGAFLKVLDTGQVQGIATGTAGVVAQANGVSSLTTVVNVQAPNAACTSTTYQPNYYREINTPGTANVSGNFRYWSHSPLKVRFVRDVNWTQALEDIFRTGMSQWQSATSNGIAFTDTDSASDFDIEVSFVNASDLSNNAIGITYASYDANTLEMKAARVQISNDLPRQSQELTTCSHELGHALGIGGHSPNDSDLMFYAENGTTSPSLRDLNTLKTVYCNSFPLIKSPSKRPANIVTVAIQ